MVLAENTHTYTVGCYCPSVSLSETTAARKAVIVSLNGDMGFCSPETWLNAQRVLFQCFCKNTLFSQMMLTCIYLKNIKNRRT